MKLRRPNLIQVFEYDKLTTTDSTVVEKRLTTTELNKLYEFNDRNKNVYFTSIRGGIKLNNYVGVIQIGGLTIEILPKIDRDIVSSEENCIKWQSVLMGMLSVCKKISVDTISEANLSKRYNSLLDLYFEIYLDEVYKLLRKGLIKKYRKQSANSLSLKGRIDFAKNIQKNLIHQERFYTTHQVYDYEHLVNQILLKGLRVLQSITVNAVLKDKIGRILLDFPDIKETQISEQHFKIIPDSRKLIDYKRAINIAKMLILNYSPDISNGQENMIALLFDMNKLWEEYIYRMLKRANDPEYSINYQDDRPFWEERKIKPDLVITKLGVTGETFIIDTKWKIIEDDKPADADLKQMFAYNVYWETGISMLLYPCVKSRNEKLGNFHKVIKEANHCKVGFINVLDDNDKLDYTIGASILKKMTLKIESEST